MPYKLHSDKDGWYVVNTETGEPKSKKPLSKTGAEAQMAALYANEPAAKKKEGYDDYGMVAFSIHPRHWPEILAGYPGETAAPESLHITLAYLGEIADQDLSSGGVLEVLQKIRDFWGPLKGEIAGMGRFTNTHLEGQDAVFASFDSPHIQQFRAAIVNILRDYGINVVDNHGFTPHITVGYIPSDAPTPDYRPPVIPMWFDAIMLHWGPEIFRIPLSLDHFPTFQDTLDYLNYALQDIKAEFKEKMDAPEYKRSTSRQNCANCAYFQPEGPDEIASWCALYDFHADPAYTCKEYAAATFVQEKEMDQKEKALIKSEADGEHPSSHYLVAEDPQKVTTWRLRIYNPDGSLNHRLMGGAWGALTSNHRGNPYSGPDKSSALKKLKALYKKEGMEIPEKKEKELLARFKEAITSLLGGEKGRRYLTEEDILAFLNENGEDVFQRVKETESTEIFVVKDYEGRSRWLLLSSNAFLDREGDLIKRKALEDDVARADETGVYGPLLWWHIPAKLGDCDFNMMVGDVLLESGTFINEQVAASVKENAENLAASLGFLHLRHEPRGMLSMIRRYERSLLPKNKAANQFTKLLVARKESDMTTPTKDKVAELAKMVKDDGVLSAIFSAAGDVSEKAKALGLTEDDFVARFKELDLSKILLANVMGTKEDGSEDDEDEEDEKDGKMKLSKELGDPEAMAQMLGDVMKKSITQSLGEVNAAIKELRADMDAIKSAGPEPTNDALAKSLERLTSLEGSQKEVGEQFSQLVPILKEILGDLPSAVATELKAKSIENDDETLTDAELKKLKEDGKLPPVQMTQKEIDANPAASLDQFLTKMEVVSPNGS